MPTRRQFLGRLTASAVLATLPPVEVLGMGAPRPAPHPMLKGEMGRGSVRIISTAPDPAKMWARLAFEEYDRRRMFTRHFLEGAAKYDGAQWEP